MVQPLGKVKHRKLIQDELEYVPNKAIANLLHAMLQQKIAERPSLSAVI